MANLATWFGSFLRVIFARESLPPAPAASPTEARRGALELLFRPEPLAEEPPLNAPPRGRWLAWLFAPERLDG
jgi:hypothetical protein